MKKLLIISYFLTPLYFFSQFSNIEDPKRLGGNVNTSAEENFPIFLKSDGSLYFTRTFDEDSKYGMYDQNIWKSEKEGELTYQKGENVRSGY